MMILWKIAKLDGSIHEILQSEPSEPVPGDERVVRDVPIKITEVIKAPETAEKTGEDFIAFAEERIVP